MRSSPPAGPGAQRFWATTAIALRMLGREADAYVRLRMGCALLCVLCGAGLVGLSPLLLARSVDLLGTGAFAALGPLLGAYVAIHWIGRSLNEFRLLAYGPAEQRLARRVSERLFDHLLALPLSALRERQSGSFAQIMANGIAGLRIVLTHVALTLLPVLVEFTTVALVLIQLGRAEFLPLFGASVLLYLLAFRFSMRRIVGPSRAMSRAQVEASAALQDLLANGETLKSFAAEPYARGRYAAQLQATEREFRRFYRNRAGGGLVVTLVFALSLAAALALAAHQVANGALTVGSFVLVNAYMLQMVRPLELVGFAMRDIGQGIAFLEQMDQLFRIPRERDAAGPDLPAPPRGAGALTFDRVSFGYEPGRKVLRDISFSVEPGMTLAIVGPSGSGKSSIARLLLRLYDPDGGRILLDGRPIDTMKLTELRRAVATVPQDISLFNATIDENVALAHGPGDRAALDRVLALAQLDDLLARLPEGGATMVGERGLNLSGGERQRVAIARAALRRPSIYVFDEATAALDARTEQAILARFRELARGCTTLIVAHRLASIIDADRILVLDQGLVVERGTHGELLRAGGLYASLWRLQHAPEGGQDVAQ